MGLWTCPLFSVWPVLYRHVWEKFRAWDYCLQQWNPSEYEPSWQEWRPRSAGRELHVHTAHLQPHFYNTAAFPPEFKASAEDEYQLLFQSPAHTGPTKVLLFLVPFRTVMRCCWWNPLTGCCKTSGTGLSNTCFTSTSSSMPCISSSSL